MARLIPGLFPTENGVSPEERNTSTEPVQLAQGGDNRPPLNPQAEKGIRAKRLVPFKFKREGVTIRGAVDAGDTSFLDTTPDLAPSTDRPALRDVPDDRTLVEIAAAVASCNRLADSAGRIKNVLIHPQFSTDLIILNNELIVQLQARRGDMSAGSVTHEMGHAIFDSYRKKRRELGKAVCHLFLRLTAGVDLDRPSEIATCAGVRMVSVQEWSDDKTIFDHPQGNADEFWASALAGFRINRSGFEASVARATTADPSRVTSAGRDLLLLLGAVNAGRAFDQNAQRLIAGSNTPDAEGVLNRIGNPGTVISESDPGDIRRLLMAL